MTEEEWLSEATAIWNRVKFAHERFGERKLRLFAVACCRRIAHLINDERSRGAVAFVASMAERGAAGKRGRPAMQKEAKAAVDEAVARAEEALEGEDSAHYLTFQAQSCAAWAAYFAVLAGVDYATDQSAGHATLAAAYAACKPTPTPDPFPPDRWNHIRVEEQQQALLLFDIFGNPFQPVMIAADVLAANDRAAVKLAQGIYDDEAFDRLGILADALEEAGCADERILRHCREGGVHVRGCWVVDLVLGK
jgi:hypothetical protein